MIIKQYSQRRQAKCNFCFEWFNSQCTMKNSIHLCGDCLEKALKTTCYKVPSPDGKEFYQLFLFRNNLKIEIQSDEEQQVNAEKTCIIQNIDDYRNQQLKKLSQKWSQITEQIQRMPSFGQNQMNQYTEIFRQQIKSYPSAHDVLFRKREQKNKQTAPLRQKCDYKQNKQNIQLKTEQYKPIQSPMQAYLNFSIPPLPLQKLQSQRYHSPKKNPIKQFANSPSKLPLMPLQFNRAFSSKINTKSNHPQKSKKLTQVSTSSFKTDRQPKKSLSRNPSQQSLAPRPPFSSSSSLNPPFSVYSKQKREKDLLLISQNALKQKIYTYLQNFSIISPTLYLPMTFSIYDAIQNTSCLNKCIELVSYNVENLEIRCYLEMLEWTGVDVLKLVKVGLTDGQFREVMAFLRQKKLETLVVTSNRLTQGAVGVLWGIWREGEDEKGKESKGRPFGLLKNVYLGRNRIGKAKVKDQIKDIQSWVNLYI